MPNLPNFFQKVTLQDRLFFTKHLATMIKAGIPLLDAIETLKEQNRSKNLEKVLTKVLTRVKNGKDLGDSLERKNGFDSLYLSLIKVGEESGTLEESLEFLSEQLNKDYSLKKKVQAALLYPGIILASTLIMGGFIALYVLPKLVDFFDAFDFPLPLSTKILLWMAAVSKDYGVLIVSTFILATLAFLAIVQIRVVKLRWHAIVLKMPLFGTLLHFNQLARFSRNFGILIKSGIPINRSLEITAVTLSNENLKVKVKEMSTLLQKGKSLHEILKSKHFHIFPPLVRKMVGVGEKTGKLDSTLLYVGDFYEEEIDSISKNFTTIIEPVLLLSIGLVVGFVALAIISPIYELTGSIRR